MSERSSHRDSTDKKGKRPYTPSPIRREEATNKDKRQNAGDSGRATSRSHRQSRRGRKALSTASASTSNQKPSQPLAEIGNVGSDKGTTQGESSSKKVTRSSSRTHQTTGTPRALATGQIRATATADAGNSAMDTPKQISSSTSMRERSQNVMNSATRVKFKVTFPGLDGSPEKLMALTKRQTERWINLLEEVQKKAPKPSLRGSRMADSTPSARNTNKDSSGLLRKILPIYVVGDVMELRIDVKIGASTHSPIVDTGSAVTWLPKERYKRKNPTEIVAKGDLTPISYILMPGELPASLYKDDFAIDDVAIQDQEFMVVHVPIRDLHKSFREGVIGIGNSKLTQGMIKNDSRSILTPLDNMVKQRVINAHSVVLDFYVWDSKRKRLSGVLTLGGIDDLGKDAKYVEASQHWPACNYLSVDVSSSLSSKDSQKGYRLFENKTGIIDTGVPLILLKEEAFEKYRRKVGARHYKFDWWYVTESDYGKMEELRFSFLNGVDYEPVEIVLEPKEQVVEHGGIKIDGENCFILAISPMLIPYPNKIDAVWMPDFILGNLFLRSIKVIVDGSKIYQHDEHTYGVKIGFEKHQFYD